MIGKCSSGSLKPYWHYVPRSKTYRLNSTKPELLGENCIQKSPLLLTSFNPEVLWGEHLDITSLFAEWNMKFLTVLCGQGSAVHGAGQAPGSCSAPCSLQVKEGLENRFEAWDSIGRVEHVGLSLRRLIQIITIYLFWRNGRTEGVQ